MTVFTTDVSFATHEQVKDGNHDAGWHRVTVMADSGDEAILIACQMVATTQNAMPTDASVLI